MDNINVNNNLENLSTNIDNRLILLSKNLSNMAILFILLFIFLFLYLLLFNDLIQQFFTFIFNSKGIGQVFYSIILITSTIIIFYYINKRIKNISNISNITNNV
jgi:hypothetical protein